MQSFAKGLYNKPTWQWLLLPFSLLYFCIVTIRKWLYKLGIFSTYKSHIPTIIVGNISVGGNGKTPIVLALIDLFIAQGKKPAVLSRGYGGSLETFPHHVGERDAASEIGDEPAMIYARHKTPIIIDPIRRRGIQFIESHLAVDVVICDDGLQHYALGRDLELCVMDERGIGNGFMLPMGPLREPAARLEHIDLLMLNGEKKPACLQNTQSPVIDFRLKPMRFVNLLSREVLEIEQAQAGFQQNKIAALAGIGNPNRFFDTLSNIGLALDRTFEFADHYAYSAKDLPQDQIVLMTEKDAIKCSEFAHENCWYLQVDAELPASFASFIDSHLKQIKET